MSRLSGIMLVIAVSWLADFAAPVRAQSIRSLGAFKAWSAYATLRAATTICFIHSKPVSVEPETADDGQAYFYVTHRPAENIAYEMSLVAGFEFHADSVAKATIGSREYSLFTRADAAWLENPGLSAEMALAMRQGNEMRVVALNQAGTNVTLTFSLSGATASMHRIDQSCGL